MADSSTVSEIDLAANADATALPPANPWTRNGGSLDVFRPRGADSGPCLSQRTVALEWAILVVVVFAFCTAFLSLDDTRILPGNEADIVQSLDWTLINSLKQFGQFPLWNPYLRAGFPFVADPFLHVYNPLATLSVLLFGVWDGFKVALFLSFLTAALGMWWMGAVLGLERPSRIWMGLMYAFTGQAVARFFQGEYDFVLGFAWIPWALAFILLAMRTRRRLHVVGAVVALALLFFSGNVYYTFYMGFVGLLLAAVGVIGVDGAARRLRWRGRILLIVVIIGLLALGLAAVQWLPMVDYWKSYTKVVDTQLIGSHSLRQIWLDYVSKDQLRPDAIKTLPPEEFYAYTGIWPFLLLAFVPLGVRPSNRRALIFFGLLLLVSVAYIATRYMPWAGLYVKSEFWSQFRYQTRMLIYGVVALIALAGCGLDAIWRRVRAMPPLRRVSVPEVARWSVARLGSALLILFMIWSVFDVYSTNQRHARSREFYPPPYELMSWLRQHDDSIFYVGTPNNWHGPIVSKGMRFLDAWYGLEPQLPTEGATNVRLVRARPHYVALGNDKAPGPPADLVQQFSQHSIWRMPESLPFAFAVQDALLYDPAGGAELAAADVRPVQPALADPNRTLVQVDSGGGETLVLLTSAYRGWQLAVDGRPAALRNVGGYLAVPLQPGAHRYEFTFDPVSFKVGLVVSLISILGLLGLAIMDGRSKRLRLKIDAIYAGGTLHPAVPLNIPDGTPVHVTVELDDEPASRAATSSTQAPEAGPEMSEPSADIASMTAPTAAKVVTPAQLLARDRSQRGLERLGWVLFCLGMFVYLFTRLWHIDKFPIYFFTDEAANPLFAQGLFDNGFHNAQGVSFPLYFELAANRWGPLLSVYIHAFSSALFGKSVIVTRTTQALVSLLAPLAVALILKQIFKARFWWAGVLLMALAPAWFLHSRTGFETIIAASFYACFILFYMLYRTRSPRFLYAAILFGAATFYTYSNGQMIMGVAGLLLGVTDIRYHLKHRRTTGPALLLIGVLAIPALRFRAAQPESLTTHLRALDSYWFYDKPLSLKLAQFVKTYAYGMSPAYWFIPNETDLVRHRMLGYGNINIWLLPFFLIGVGMSLWRMVKGSAPHRILLLTAIATPAGAALAHVALTRVMAFVVPAAILTALGIEYLLSFAKRRLSERVLAPALFVVLTIPSLLMLRDVLVNGPLWYRDYGLYGMQYGATQLFGDEIPRYLAEHPDNQVIVSPTWANGTDNFIRFFLPKDQQRRVQMLNVDYFMAARRDLNPNMVFVMPAYEYERARTSDRFKQVDVERILPYPDGTPGFYFIRLAYADDLEAILAREREVRSRPVTEEIELDGQLVQVSHSIFDGGQLRDLFDGDTYTLARGLEANPLVVELDFPEPRAIKALEGTFGSMDFALTAELTGEGMSEPVVYSETYRGLPPDPRVEMTFDRGPEKVAKLRLAIQQLNAGEEVHVHVRELKMK
jgi:hypothetical protein